MAKRNITKDNILLKEWIDSLPDEQKAGFKKIIIRKCDISPETFKNWIYGNAGNGKSGIRAIYKKTINEIACETVFDL